MSKKAAEIISAQIIFKPHSVLGLATGSSVLGIYKELISKYDNGDLDFSEISSVNLDEYVSLDKNHPQSYRYYMNEHLFKYINININRTFVPFGAAADIDKECKRYDKIIEQLGRIDLQLLGIGTDGHIGFNEPENHFIKHTHEVNLHPSTIKANSRFFADPNDVPKKAITMGIAPIMQAKKILLVANGQSKKAILEEALFGPITPIVPASILQLHPDLTVIFSEE